jgi:tetratricopeptide (TPR) repeat protein
MYNLKKIILLISIFFFSSITILHAQDFAKVHTLIEDGIKAIYNIDFPAALDKFQQAKSIAPADLRGPFFESTVYFWKALFTRNRSDYNTYLDLSDKIIDKCQDLADKNNNDLDAHFYLGWTYTLRSFLMYMVDKEVLRPATEIQDGNKALTFVVEKNPQYYDAYLGLGLYNYIISMIPRKLQWLTSILGYSGNRDEGKKDLQLASEKGTYTNTEAKVYLTLLAWREEDYPLAESYATQLTTAYPESPATWMLWGLLNTQQDKLQEAIIAYEKALKYNETKQSDVVFKTVYGALGNAYFKMNDFGKTVDYIKKYLSYVTKDDMYNNRLYNIGVSLEMLGRKSEAMDYYRQARKDFTADNEWEKHWYRMLNYRATHPINMIDSLLIVADNNRAAGKLQDAIGIYERLNGNFDQVFSDDIKVQINHGLGAVYFKQKEYDKAMEQFTLNLNLAPAEEKWLVPDSYFQIGRCYLRKGNVQLAKSNFDKAQDIDYDYDFKDAMDGRIKHELSKYEN